MNASQNRTVFGPPVSRSNPGYVFYAVVLFLLWPAASCRTKKDPGTEIKIAKTLPPVYVSAGDSSFVFHQDTLYHGKTYFTGYRYGTYENGDTAFIQGYFNGLEEGWQRTWYRGGQPEAERFYINGKKEGTHRGWWPGGNPQFLFTLAGDEYEGAFSEWYASGNLGKKFHYVHGREEGSQQLWWDNGSIRANYVIRNGKKYGLIGLKICANPYDSVFTK